MLVDGGHGVRSHNVRKVVFVMAAFRNVQEAVTTLLLLGKAMNVKGLQ